MSQENVEIVRWLLDGFPAIQEELRRGRYSIGEPFAEDVVWDASDVGGPDFGDGVFHGREGVARFWAAWLSPWEDVSFDYELLDGGDMVLSLIDQRTRAAGGMALTTPRYAQVWRFDGRSVVHWKLYRDPAEALEAVGLSE